MAKELIMYSRSTGCPMVTLARRVLDEHALAYREVMIDQDATAHRRVLDWTGFLAVPTLVVAESGEDLPYALPADLAPGHSPRGVNRGTMITEPNVQQLIGWLVQEGFIDEDPLNDAGIC
jgi:glutaredoxin